MYNQWTFKQRIIVWITVSALCAFYLLRVVSVTANDVENKLLFDEKLALADEIRSSHREQFNNLVSELVSRRGKLSEMQNIYLDYLLGYQQLLAGNLDIGISLLDKVIANNHNDTLKYRAIITKINAHTTSKNYAEGFIVLNKLLPKLKLLENTQAYQEAILVVSLFYSRLGQYQLSKVYASRLLASSPSKRFNCLGTMLEIEAAYYLGQLRTDVMQSTWIEICDKVNEPIASNTIRLVMAKIYLDENQPKQALNLLLSQLFEVEDTGYYLLASQYYTYIASAYFATGNAETAEQFALKVLNNVGPLHSSDAVVIASQLLFQINKQRGHYAEALSFHEQHLKYLQDYRDDIKARDITFKISEEDARQKNLEIEILAQRNKVLNLENSLATNQKQRDQLIQALFLLIIILLSYWGYRSRNTQKKLKILAAYDPLTNIYNRRYFTDLALSALNYYCRAQQPVSLLLFDLDKFKAINDKYGHQVGDWVLKRTIEECKSYCRKNDIFGRFGGEEFTILLPSCDTKKAIELAEKYRLAIANINTIESGYEFNITASFGISCTNQVGYDLNTLISTADKAMYNSKKSGRDCLTCYDTAIEVT